MYHPSQMGYDGLFFARNDYADKNQRLKDNTMEMVWRPSRSLGNASDLFTGVFLFHYGPPPGFCFDIKCADPPIQVGCAALKPFLIHSAGFKTLKRIKYSVYRDPSTCCLSPP